MKDRNQYILTPKVSVGSIGLGMNKAIIREILGPPDELKHAFQFHSYPDHFEAHDLRIDYNKQGDCVFIEIMKPSVPILFERIVFEMSRNEFLEWIKAMDAEVVADREGVTSYRLGVCIYAPMAIDDIDVKIETVAVFAEGYYDRK